MSPGDLQRALQAVEPAAVLVAPAVLDKIIRQTLKLPGWMWTVPHRRTWNVERQFLFRFVEQEDLLVRPDQLLPATVLLLAAPGGAELEADQELLRAYWRLLFHASLDLELTNQAVAGKWTPAAVEERIDRLGSGVFGEVRSVLLQEHYLPPNPDARAVYLEFVAVFLELYYFARPLLESYFPSIRDVEAVKKVLEEDVSGATVLERTRLPGTAAPGLGVASSPHEAHEFFYALVGESDAAQQSGNLVRAAIQRSRAARVAPAAQAYDTRKQAVALLEALLGRLQPALEIPNPEVPEWSKHLPELLDKADQGSRPPEAYLLYDLQKVCLDFEREIYTLDLVEWLLSGGKKPVQRPLTSQRLVRVTRHVRSAAQRLTMARLSENDRKHFGGMLQAALARCENRVRERFRPLLWSALEDVGLGPHNPSERTAFLKLTEELLDRILEYGFLTFSDLRDVLSRNQLKMPDLSDPQDFIRGDPLLRLDRRLATLLDGVYRRGEIYLRVLERFTALNFGTALGRLITQFVTIPFLGAYLLVQVLNHFVLQPLGVENVPVYVFVPVWGMLGAFLLGVLHSPTVRNWCADLGRALWRPVKAACVDFPLWVVHNTALVKVLTSWTFQLFYWYILKPLVLCVLLWFLVPETFSTWLQVALTFLAANFLVNSRPGQAAAETLNHALVRFFALLRSGLISGLIRLVVQLFKHIMHMMEAVLFKVDEWLRFRGGDSRLAMAVRVILGVVWFPISYLARFNMVVLIEPVFNPVKFPVCSIATKIIYPTYVVLQPWLMETFTPLFGNLVTWAVVTWVLFWLPDVFGFLFWEMKENWSLYKANRGPALQPAIIGARGETMPRLLRPGFHSGTIPKLFAKLRHAEQKALETGNFTHVRAWRVALEEVEEAVRLFVTREFLVLLAQDEAWKNAMPSVGPVRLATNQIRVELIHKDHPEQPLWLEFEEQGGTLSAGATPADWLKDLSGAQQRSLDQALAVLYQLAGAKPAKTATTGETGVVAARTFGQAIQDLVAKEEVRAGNIP
jgi:hypothetical protein